MRCRRVCEQLEAYLDGEQGTPPPAGWEQVAAHLERCESCRRELSRRRGLRNLLAEVPVPPVPEGFAGRVVARLQALDRRAAPRRGPSTRRAANAWHRLRMASAAAAALAAGLALGAFLGNDVGRESAPQRQASEAARPDALTGAGLGRLVVDYDDSLAQAYLDLTAGRDG